jgi:hypothetical protein
MAWVRWVGILKIEPQMHACRDIGVARQGLEWRLGRELHGLSRATFSRTGRWDNLERVRGVKAGKKITSCFYDCVSRYCMKRHYSDANDTMYLWRFRTEDQT